MKITMADPVTEIQFHDENLTFIDRLLIKPRRELSGFYRRMFDEDFSRVFHPSSRRTGNVFDVSASDEEFSSRLFKNLSTGFKYTPQPVDEIIRTMVENVAQSLLRFGKAYYFLHGGPAKEEVYITSSRTERIFTLGGACFQFLPKRCVRHYGRDDEVLERELRLLDGKKLMRFCIPRSIRRSLSQQNSILASLDKYQQIGTDYLPRVTHENPVPMYDFDFRVWRDTSDFALYRATRKTGWTGRRYEAGKRSDFYVCHRLIRFRRNQLVLRDHILTQLSNELTRVGKHYQANFSISISPTNALLSIAELNDLEERLSQES